MKYEKLTKLSIRSHPELSERWVQERLAALRLHGQSGAHAERDLPDGIRYRKYAAKRRAGGKRLRHPDEAGDEEWADAAESYAV